MKLIVGLGNPGLQYRWTRHNVGFEAIDKLAYDNNIELSKNKFRAIYGEGIINYQKVILVKPLTYMNLSGESIRDFFNFYKDLQIEDLIVICDDINLDLGTIRIRPKGSAGGQNGLKNIIYHLDTDEFTRVRIGVGKKPDGFELSNFVLSKFSEQENQPIIEGISKCTDAIEMILKENGLNTAMNQYNKKINKNLES